MRSLTKKSSPKDSETPIENEIPKSIKSQKNEISKQMKSKNFRTRSMSVSDYVQI